MPDGGGLADKYSNVRWFMNVNIGGHHSPPLQHQQLDIIDNNKTKCCNLHFSTLLKLHLCREYRFKISGYFDGGGGDGAGEEDWCKWKNVLYVIKSVSK